MQAAIFDMDGLLIDSEPLWRLAEKRVFGSVGISLTDDMCKETTGLRTDEFVAYWYTRYPWKGKTLKHVEREIVAQVKALVEAEGKALPGVHDILETFRRHRFRLGLASSSPYILIDAVIDTLGIRPYFHVLRSATDESYGKPHPAVYLTTARDLNVHPSACLVFEDSLAGVQSAKAAGMRTIAVPAADQYQHEGFNQADVKLRSLDEFSVDMLQA